MAVNSPWQAYRLASCAKEPETVRWLESEVRPGDCLYDVGANVGAYSLVASAVGGAGVRILAFEPGFGTFAELVRNIHLNHAERSITPLPIALSDRTGLADFRYSDTMPGAALHSGGNRVADVPAELVLPTVAYRLDDLIEALGLPPPSLLKLDVDGPELEVLKGADRTLANPSLRSCLVELERGTPASGEVVELLAGKGFAVTARHVRGGTGPLENVIFGRMRGAPEG
jgi:FkbM family methyltransferase